MVGAGRFERPTPCAQDIRSPHLRINRFNNLQTLRVGPCGNFSYNLDGKPAIRLAKPPTKPTGSPAGSADCKINQRGRAPAVAAVGRSVVERLADPSYNRDFGQVPGHFPERRFHGQWRDRGRSPMLNADLQAGSWSAKLCANFRMADKLETGPRFLARRWLKLPHRRARSDLEGDDVLVRGPADPLVIAQDLRRHARHPPGVGVDQAGRIEIQIRPHKPDQETAIRG